MKAACSLVAVLLGLAAPTLARAQSDTALAETLYQEGKRLTGDKNYVAACPKFAESYKLEPATGTLLNLAACYETWGKYATAWAHFSEALVAAKREGQDFRVRYAEEHLAAVEAKLTRLQIELAPGADVPGLEVKLDGRSLPSAAFGVPAPVDPGLHVLEASAPGRQPARIEVQADAPQTTLRAVVPALAAADETAPAAAPVESPSPAPAVAPTLTAQPAALDAGTPSSTRPIGFVLGGIGLVSLGVGTVFHFLAASADEDARSLCTGGSNGDQCADRDEFEDHESEVNAAESNQLVSFVGLGVGAAALVTGAVLVVTSPSSEAGSGGVRLVPGSQRALAGASLLGRF